MQSALDVVLVFWADRNRRLRREHYVLNFLSVLIKCHVGNLLVFADRLIPIELLDLDNLPIRAALANALEFFFFGSKFLDSFLSGDFFRGLSSEEPFFRCSQRSENHAGQDERRGN